MGSGGVDHTKRRFDVHATRAPSCSPDRPQVSLVSRPRALVDGGGLSRRSQSIPWTRLEIWRRDRCAQLARQIRANLARTLDALDLG